MVPTLDPGTPARLQWKLREWTAGRSDPWSVMLLDLVVLHYVTLRQGCADHFVDSV